EIKSRKRDRLVKRSELLTSLTMKLIAEKVSNETLSNIFILSFDPEVLRLGYKQTPALKYVLNLERPEELSNNKSETDHLHAFCMPVSRLRESFVKKARAGGKQIWTYSCNVPSQVRKALSFRADLIMTDRPGWLPQYLNITDPRK
nr:hypothetical protein [bacterium]